MIGQREIEQMIPHRPPFLFIDRVEELEPGLRCVARMRIDPEVVFAGHFPGKPIVPGVLIIEAVGQTAAVMMAAAAAGGAIHEALLGAVNRFKFLKPVLPGHVVCIETKMLTSAGSLSLIQGTAYVDGAVVANGELSVVCAR